MGDLLMKAARIVSCAALVAACTASGFSQRRTSKRPAPRNPSPVIKPAGQATAPVAASKTSNITIGPGTANLRLRAAFDYDNDGKADFTIFRPSDSIWYVKKTGGGADFTKFGNPTTDYMTPGDYDGDGKADVSIFRDSDGTWWRINSSNGTVSVNQFGSPGDEPVARDYDGDGKTDLAVARRANGVITWWILGSLSGQATVTQWGASTDFTSPGDYDGDGKFDISIQRPGTSPSDAAYFWTLGSSGGVQVVQWGRGSDLVVPGDYDGDGKTDYAIVREGATPADTLTWWILKSSGGGALVYNFGNTGTDYPVQNDYDGDGKTDPAIWRDPDGNWWVLQSTNSSQTVTQWGSPSDYPIQTYDTH